MKKYIYIAKGFLLERMVYRFSLFFNALEKYLYVLLIFFLWKAIYRSLGQESLSIDFKSTFTYLSLATAIFGLFQTWVDWDISQLMLSGDLSIILTKPLDFQVYMFFKRVSWVVLNLLTITLPILIILKFILKMPINLGINFIFFFLSVIISYLIYFNIDFIVGVTAFFTETIWGLSVTKDAVILFLSGGIVPIPLFPENLRRILEILPFKTIYHMPIEVLINRSFTIFDYLNSLIIQIFWLLVFLTLSRIYYKLTERFIRINGG
ncbi:ABC transporter permease [Dictyoglomus sp.]|jgi:ABC-2 type transport system permease protein|uniref:ABC transporter permease n=1 Tax=Dictyoglomus sp. TaxID=28205 RepID=UPI003D12D9AD